jgi:hypothetical protein
MSPMRKYIISGSLAILLGVAVGITYRHLNDRRNPREARTTASYVIDVSDTRQLVGWADNVFIGRVEAGIGTIYATSSLPWSLYRVRVLENIKGNLPEVVKVGQEGGFSIEQNTMLLMGDDMLLAAGNEYLFVTKADSRGWHTLVPSYGDLPVGASRQRRAITDKFREAYAQEIPYDPKQ